jgi:protein gp37
MKLPEFITFTGVDDCTDPYEMAALADQYPIEWGILFSPKRQGQGGRYPALSTVEWLFNELPLRYAAHLCGGDAREVIETGQSRHESLLRRFCSRAQINTADQGVQPSLIGRWATTCELRAILQSRGEFPSVSSVDVLFDASGGRGIAPSDWPIATSTTFCGYAGGLCPGNVADAVKIIGQRASRYWIDMETGVRDQDDRFSIALCRQVCEAVYGRGEPGCKHCYAMKLAGTRLQHHPSRSGLTIDTKAGPVWTGEVRFNEQWLTQPLCWSKPRRVFVCAHADLFHEAVPDEWIDRVFAVMAMAPQHTFQVLTKRPERMHKYMWSHGRIHSINGKVWLMLGTRRGSKIDHGGNWRATLPLPNVWIGVSVENQEAADERIPLLLDTPAAVRWISAEPLLGPVDLCRIDHPNYSLTVDALRGIDGRGDGGLTRDITPGPTLDWVVVGGESGHNARPTHPEWVRAIRDQCQVAGVPFLFKQWGEWSPFDRGTIDGALLAHPYSTDEPMQRFGKKVAGRLLDGVQHDGYPEINHD